MHACGVHALPPAPQPRRAVRPSFQSAKAVLLTPYAQGVLRMRNVGGITTLGVLCVLLNHLSMGIKTAHVRFYSRKRLHPSLPQRIAPTTLFLLSFTGLSYTSLSLAVFFRML